MTGYTRSFRKIMRYSFTRFQQKSLIFKVSWYNGQQVVHLRALNAG